MIKHNNRVCMTQKDYNAISSLVSVLQDRNDPSIEGLYEELIKAELFHCSSDIPHDVVTMHSIVKYTNLNANQNFQVQIVYPDEADISLQRVSILSAVGSALIGLQTGDQIEWPMPNGSINTLRIDQVYQGNQ